MATAGDTGVELPECVLIDTLTTKASDRSDTDFDFLHVLNEFRKRVAQEVRQINELFPDYTPHDENYHLKNLFHIAGRLLGGDLIEGMNSAELLVLAAALYGHDWGMAVSRAQKHLILTGEPLEEADPDESRLLRNEDERFAEFARRERLPQNDAGNYADIRIEAWREYVRQTHAFRSGERVRQYFERQDAGVAEAVARVCEGHGLNIEDIEDYNSYPPDFNVLRENVNLRALTVYLRLIDLFDLAEDRTPYVIWKFVAPTDPRSRMEWAKHRALQAVTCPPYQHGRIIQVDGGTDDHEVYAALKDLRLYCEQELKAGNDVLARMNDPRHALDLRHVQWRVQARGFEPASIRFEFDRNSMFQILSDEIYQGDPYVFLRELLQNSIDAIRMRCEILKRCGLNPPGLGVMRVDVQHADGGDATITWTDDGVGMDEHVVKNYLAVAGKSYYQSQDFEREGLEMDPISRFGVGILSCFMVAEAIEIETFRDPYFPPPGRPLKITIPSVRRQFRIQPMPAETASVGTTVRVFVQQRKLPVDEDADMPKPLDVTAYLKGIAGFVEFPILVTESGENTVILHPARNADEARDRFGGDVHVHQLDLEYPWHDVIVPQDLANAREVANEVRYDLQRDLGLSDYEGVLCYLTPPGRLVDSLHSRYRGREASEKAEQETNWFMAGGARARPFRFRLLLRSPPSRSEGLGASAMASPMCRVFRDGILVPHLGPRDDAMLILLRETSPEASLTVNIPKDRSRRIDLSRTRILLPAHRWLSPIESSHANALFRTREKPVLEIEPRERLVELAHIMTFCGLSVDDVLAHIPLRRIPVMFVTNGGNISVLEVGDIVHQDIFLLPLPAIEWLNTYFVERRVLLHHWGLEALRQWRGGAVVPLFFTFGDQSMEYKQALSLSHAAILATHYLSRLRLVKPPWQGHPYLFQYCLSPLEDGNREPMEHRMPGPDGGEPLSLTTNELAVLWETPHHTAWDLNIPSAFPFPRPYQPCLGDACGSLNLHHPVIQLLTRCRIALRRAERDRTLPQAELGRLADADFGWFEFRCLTDSVERFLGSLTDRAKGFVGLCHDLGLIDSPLPEEFEVTPSDFIPGAFLKHPVPHLPAAKLEQRSVLTSDNVPEWGQPIDEEVP